MFVKRVWLLGVVALVMGGCISEKRIARAEGQYQLGAAYFKEADYESAVKTLRGAAELDPRNWRAWNGLGLAYIAKGDTAAAQDAFDRALHLNKGEGEILINLGALQLKTGQVKEAIATFQLATQDLDYRNQALVLSNLARALYEDHAYDAALSSAQEAVRRSPGLCEGWFHVGLIQEAKGQPAAALEAYRTLQERCPGEALGAHLRAGCLMVKGDQPADGVAELQALIVQMPGTPFADQARLCLAGAVN